MAENECSWVWECDVGTYSLDCIDFGDHVRCDCIRQPPQERQAYFISSTLCAYSDRGTYTETDVRYFANWHCSDPDNAMEWRLPTDGGPERWACTLVDSHQASATDCSSEWECAGGRYGISCNWNQYGGGSSCSCRENDVTVMIFVADEVCADMESFANHLCDFFVAED